MKKSSKIITAIIILILVALISFYSYKHYQETKEIQEMNKVEFKLLTCVSNCSIIHSMKTNTSSISKSCMDNCTNENKVSIELQKKYSQQQLIKDYDYMKCTKAIDVRDSMTYEKYQSCLIALLPKLRERYSYLK